MAASKQFGLALPGLELQPHRLAVHPQRALPGDAVDFCQHAVEFRQRGGRIARVVRPQGQLEEAVTNRGIVRLQAGNLPAELLGPVVFLDLQEIIQKPVPEADFIAVQKASASPARFSISAPA